MNLKESFRYQNFLDSMMRSAVNSIVNREHCLTVTKTHFRRKANPDAIDVIENVEVENYFKNDDVLRFMQWLVNEKKTLTEAIGKAKESIDLDLDAAIETNKFRQQVSNAIKNMLRFTPRKTVEQGHDYKFNVDGNQIVYKDGTTTAKTIAKECGGDCTECLLTEGGCWTLKQGEQVVFNEH